MSDAPHEAHVSEHGDHPTPRKYVAIAVFLAVITAAEVGIYYIEMSDALLVAFLMLFAVIKFAMVAMWFMHLRFDSRLFRRVFVAGIILALIVFSVVLATFFARGGPTPAITGG